MTVGSGWSVQRAAKPGDGFVLTAPGRVTKLRASSEQEEQEVILIPYTAVTSACAKLV